MSDTTAHHAHQGTNKTVSPTARKGALAGIGVVIACAIACSIPLIAAGGVVAYSRASLTMSSAGTPVIRETRSGGNSATRSFSSS